MGSFERWWWCPQELLSGQTAADMTMELWLQRFRCELKGKIDFEKMGAKNTSYEHLLVIGICVNVVDSIGCSIVSTLIFGLLSNWFGVMARSDNGTCLESFCFWYSIGWWICKCFVSCVFRPNPSLQPLTEQTKYRPSMCFWMCFFSDVSSWKLDEHIEQAYWPCCLMWFSKWNCWINFSSHFVQEKPKFVPWIFMCCCRCDCCLNVLSGHCGQVKPRSPECVAKWWFNCVTVENFFGHWLHTYCWILWWVFMWLFKFVTWANDRPQLSSIHT